MPKPGVDMDAELVAAIPDPVIGCDARGTVVFWSRAAETAYGYSAAEAVGRRAAIVLQTRFPAPLLEIVDELVDVGRWRGTLVQQTKDGQTIEVESRWVARYDEDGVHAGGFAIERALPPPPGAPAQPGTPARAATDAERLVSLGRLAGRAAHDLNNALAIIINYSAFVATELEELSGAPTEAARDTMRADLGEVQTAAERALELTRELIDHSQGPAQAPGAGGGG